ncbi:DUF1294 domain-containing protein [Sphingopyxis sp. BSN-002]|uniref:DUF1294 domain-containing protein n=1 Tax=Sphingopyxis sp. BSN-002 TaxID=2911495 RepID=UPI001EDA4134|nr:DUF1294 domain-containing protein [Sphingopyxis sp. BSN-002]UKK85377.1 DUF1294 domain-containing protein [Sphingopyxis sp. BSN-002]
MNEYILYWLIAMNLIAFVQMVLDKKYAEAGQRRIPESNLLLWAFLGGAFGTVLAARLVRHKTRKQPFATWMLIWLWVDIILLLLWWLGILQPWLASALARIAAAA